MFVETGGGTHLMYRAKLTDEQRLELHRRAHQRDIAPSLRDRLEMIRLSDAGWSIPKIALHLRQHEQTVRRWIKAFVAGGFDALSDKARGGKTSALTPTMLDAVVCHVRTSPQTWSASQIADWIAEQHQVRVSPRTLAYPFATCPTQLQAHQSHAQTQTTGRGRCC